MFYLSTTFVLVWVSFPDHPLICRLPSHHHFPVLAVPHSIPRQKSFVLLSYSSWHSHPDKSWVFSLTNSYGMHLMTLAHLSLFWVACHPSRTFPPKRLKREPQNRLPLLPITRLHPLLPLTHGPLLLYWLGTSRWCLSLMCAPLPCESTACLPFMRLPWLGDLSSLCYTFHYSFLTFCGVDEPLGLRSLYLTYSLG